MSKIICVLLLIILTTRITYSQDINSKYILDANSLFDSGDFLFAAKLYKYISETSVDTNLASEALYKFKKCGDEVAKIFMNKHYLKEKFHINKQNELWTKLFQPLLDKQIFAYSEVEINIKCGKLFDLYCVNEDLTTLQTLSKKYSNTKWGELANYDLITFRSEFNMNSQEVITKAVKFLNRYPESEYRVNTYVYLAQAYSDLWNFSISPDFSFKLREDEKLNANDYRLKAIMYNQKIIDYNESNDVNKLV